MFICTEYTTQGRPCASSSRSLIIATLSVFARKISVGNAANAWGVNSDDEIYRPTGSSWTQISGSLKHVSVANDGTVWGVNDDDEIYRWNGAAWEQFAGALKQISSAAKNIAWGVNANDRIFRLR